MKSQIFQRSTTTLLMGSLLFTVLHVQAATPPKEALFDLILEEIQIQEQAELAPLRELPSALQREVETFKRKPFPKPKKIVRTKYESTSTFKRRIA